MAKSKIDFRHLLIEAILIVFTVSLALTLSEWRESVKEANTRKNVLQNILNEIKANKADIEGKLDYHKETAIKFNTYLNSDSLWSTLNYQSGIEAIFQIMNRGLKNPSLQSGAWRSAELSGVVNSFDYQTIYRLSNLYRVQESGTDKTWKELVELFGEPEFYKPESAKQLARMFSLGLNELSLQEADLIRSYDHSIQFLETLED